MTEWVITWDNNPDIYAMSDTLLYKMPKVENLNRWTPRPGDTITFKDCVVKVVSVTPQEDGKHTFKVDITGDDIPKLRTYLTYRLYRDEP